MAAVDTSGNTVTDFDRTITIRIGTGAGELSGTTRMKADSGVATFDDLSVNRAQNGMRLRAVDPVGALASADSDPFRVTGPSAENSDITAHPTSLVADGESTSTVTVKLEDAHDRALKAGGDEVELSTTAGSLGPVADAGDGTYEAILTAPTEAGEATVTGRVNGASIHDTATVTFEAGRADLELEMTVSEAEPTEGDTVTYTITVTNRGPARATGVEVKSPVPEHADFLDTTANRETYDLETGLWHVGQLREGDSAELRVRVVVSRPGG